MQTTTQLTQHSYFTNCAEVSDENFNLLTQQQQTQFTQADIDNALAYPNTPQAATLRRLGIIKWNLALST